MTANFHPVSCLNVAWAAKLKTRDASLDGKKPCCAHTTPWHIELMYALHML